MSDQAHDPEALVSLIVNSLVDQPDQVEVRSSTNDGVLLIEVVIAEDDISKIIGRNGRVIKSIRTLTRATASMNGIDRVDVELVS